MIAESPSKGLVDSVLVTMRQVQRFVSSRVDDPADAADIAQESLVRLIARSREADIAQPGHYAITIARNLVNDRYRHMALATAPVDEEIVCPAPLADVVLSERERLAAFHTALTAMPPLRREVFMRRRLHGQSREAIAAELGLQPEAVKKHVSRALAQLARALAAWESHLSDGGAQDAA